ncbi:DNA helicase UvrD [Dehalococcoides mccartyi]|uniref:UvrD-helicase domain-containing protein n=1 Tax=Dehalococcoides mccartyi TaxID=61435 RepID=UPI00071D5E89|nr:UvrD-helicase domain-containing protein [Dehalococcoides mccartyi]KSV16612.1 DNA helicase UvrD [Dehalococcoides mccartyi]
MNQAVVAISSDFLTAFSALPRQVQGKVTEFINKFRNNPQSPGINYEKLHDAADKKICSVRIDEAYRGIVARQEESGVYLLLWVDHHDKAYAWAKRKKCEINPATGNVQVFEVQEAEYAPKPVENAGLFLKVSDSDLLKLGLPEAQIGIIKNVDSLTAFYELKNKIPEDAYENLQWIANGFPVDEVLELQITDPVPAYEADFATALQNPRSQKAFVVLEGEDELRNILAEPLEKWRVFLHPAQRKIVQKDFAGAARVLGGAGTGKTVVAMHRAKWLAGKLKGKEKLLFTTFTTNLAGDIKENLRKICSVEEQKRIEVINLDAWVSQYLREQGYSYTIAYDDIIEKTWDEAITLSGEILEFPQAFFAEEWSKVVNAQEAFTQELYLKSSRLGRGTRLDRKKRLQVWHVFEEYQNLMKDRQIRDVETAMYECRKILGKTSENARYTAVVVDEGQDLSMSAFRLLRAIAGAEHPNDMFIVGDAHQRIYKNKAVLSKCGINVRGRSSYLKINYRTTEEIRRYAFSLLKGISFDDLDEEYDDGRKCQSLTHGMIPIVNNFNNAAEEIEFVIDQLRDLEKQGTSLKNICVVARTHRLLDDYIKQLNQAGIRTYEIKTNKLDDRSFEGLRVATMHRVKGLEFQHVFIVAVNKKIMPLASAINHTDQISEAESLTAEKCLLYVALTRAQKSAYICSYGTPSEFLV